MIPVKLYLVFVFWLFGFILLWKIPLLKRARHLKDSPKLSVLIPARNEEGILGRLLDSLNRQVVKPDEVIVIDDQSEDATAELAMTAGCTVIRSKELPEGWAGKSWACWQGARKANGDLFLFLDADTFLKPDGLSRIISAYIEKGGLLSIQPYHEMKEGYERLSAIFNIVSLAGMNVFTPLGERLRPVGAFGPCMICSREDYFQVGGHETVRGEVLESIALGRGFLKANLKVACYGGKDTVSFRMYPDGLASLVEGFSKGFGTGAGAMSMVSLFMMAAWIFGGVSVTRHVVQSAILSDFVALIGWLILDVLYIFQIHWILFRIGNFGFSTALLFPIPLFFFIMVFGYSALRIFVIRKVRWKGRDVKTARAKD